MFLHIILACFFWLFVQPVSSEITQIQINTTNALQCTKFKVPSEVCTENTFSTTHLKAGQFLYLRGRRTNNEPRSLSLKLIHEDTHVAMQLDDISLNDGIEGSSGSAVNGEQGEECYAKTRLPTILEPGKYRIVVMNLPMLLIVDSPEASWTVGNQLASESQGAQFAANSPFSKQTSILFAVSLVLLVIGAIAVAWFVYSRRIKASVATLLPSVSMMQRNRKEEEFFQLTGFDDDDDEIVELN